jgi:glutamate--cysteine ligase
MQQRVTRDRLVDAFSCKEQEKVGIEVENGLVDPVTGCSVPYEGQGGAKSLLEAIVKELSGVPEYVDDDEKDIVGVKLPNRAYFTLETGGALEYSSYPSVGLAEAVRVTTTDLLRTATIAKKHGIALLSGACLPFTPRNRIPWIPKPRVQVMRDYFSRLGESGMYAEEVMALTLSTQTSLDYLSGQDFIEKMRMHVLAAPIIAALFVNSPIAEGGDSHVMSRRMQYWRKFDPRRCGILGFALNENAGVLNVIDWAIRQQMIYRQVGKAKNVHTAAPDRPFVDLIDDGFGDGTWPTIEDFKLHLCQLWPHVRPRRGTLELRASDGLPWPYFSAAPAIWVGLTYDSEARRQATAYLSGLTRLELENAADNIAEKGLRSSIGIHQVKELTHELLRLARCGLQKRVDAGIDPQEVLSYLEPLEQVIASEETFADRCITSWEGELRQSPEAYVEKYRIPYSL